MNYGRKEYIFLWFIENYSYYWHKKDFSLRSPDFIVDGLERTAWRLTLYSSQSTLKSKSSIDLYLGRGPHDDGPKDITLNYELSVLDAHGTSHYAGGGVKTFQNRCEYGNLQKTLMNEILLRRKDEYLPQDILTVRCKMWNGEGSITNKGQYFARTRIGIEKISFLHKAQNFSKLKPNLSKNLQIQYHSKTGCIVTSTLYFTDGEGQIFVQIKPTNSRYILSIQKLSLLDGLGIAIECGQVDNRLNDSRDYIKKLPLSLTREAILKRKSEYLPNDELSVICECTFSTGVEFEKIEGTQHEISHLTRAPMKHKSYKENDNDSYTTQKPSAGPSVVDDLKAIYNNQHLTDVELKTQTKSFPAHKVVLCARSSIFNAMLTNDMREKNTACINMDDLENDIVEQLLLFLYSDHVENLQWDSAIKLFYVGDKYAIEKLKCMCSSFFMENLSISTASELLLLADTHNDPFLKKIAEDFILQHEEEIFGSEEWENLIETHPQLVLKTMHLKYKKKKGGK